MTGNRLSTVLIASALALALAGCEATVAPRPSDPGLCPQVHQPVCARTGPGQSRTFTNACVAQASGYSAFSPGACEADAPGRMCPQVYQPVCGQIDGRYKTYSNDCVAGAQGASVVYRGPC